MTADDAWAALSSALEETTPPCDGQHLFTADRLADAERTLCASICAKCPLLIQCDAYATAENVSAGFWAGTDYSPKRKRSSSTTDAEADSPAPINTQKETSP